MINFTITGKFTAGNVFTAQLSDASGSFNTPSAIGTLSSMNAGTITAKLSASVANGTGYRIRVVASAPATTSPDNGANLSIAAPTITISSFATSPSANQTYIAGREVALTISTTGIFAADNQFTVEISNTAGTFGGLLGSVTASTLTSRTVTLPASIPAGTGFRFRITSTKPAINSAFSNTFEVVTPSITGFNFGANSNFVAGGLVTASFFETNGPWLTNNAFSLQLSDASGSFTNPINIPYSGSSNNNIRSLVFNIPTTTPAGAGYRMRVVSTNPVVVGTATSAFAIGALPTLKVEAATPVFAKMYAGTVFPISYIMKVTKTGTFNANTTFTVDMSPTDQPFGSTFSIVATLSTTGINELNTNGFTNVNLNISNLGNGAKRFRVRASGHAVLSPDLSVPITQTDVTDLTGTVESVNYIFSVNRCLYNTFGSGEPNNQTLFAYGQSASSLFSSETMRLFIGFPTASDNINTGSNQTCSVIIQLLNSTGLIALYRNNSVSVNISGTPSAYTATIGAVTLTRTSGTGGNSTISVQGLSTSFKLQ
jgi:hypothetical protein